MRELKKELWPHRVVVDVEPKKQESWLEENMGPMCVRWYAAGYGLKKSTYYFRDERDATWFALRWA